MWLLILGFFPQVCLPINRLGCPFCGPLFWFTYPSTGLAAYSVVLCSGLPTHPQAWLPILWSSVLVCLPIHRLGCPFCGPLFWFAYPSTGLAAHSVVLCSGLPTHPQAWLPILWSSVLVCLPIHRLGCLFCCPLFWFAYPSTGLAAHSVVLCSGLSFHSINHYLVCMFIL